MRLEKICIVFYYANKYVLGAKTESGTAAAPARDGGKDGSTIRLG